MNRTYLSQLDQQIQPIEPLSHSKVYLVWHDQLQIQHFPDWVIDEKPLLLFIESNHMANFLPYHKKKLVFVISAMRHFALDCQQQGFPVFYHRSSDNYTTALAALLYKNNHWKLSYMRPSEWDTRKAIEELKVEYPTIQEFPNTYFLAPLQPYVSRIAKGWRMEYFYREMRKRTGYLMDGQKPLGGEWNYDKENRKKLPKKMNIPQSFAVEVDKMTEEVMEMVEAWYPKHFGDTTEFSYGVTRTQALAALQYFLENGLKDFGPFEDAMTVRGSVLFHSQLSIYLNAGLISPKEVIRQIIGWREFIRIYYEAMMPDVREANYFGFDKNLPAAYWTSRTDMKCLSECVRPVIEQGYVHHIPRLMILSNFSNLTGTDPRALNEWFWLGFVDAYEWVVLPNVLGMSTFADGGVLASKPYVAGGNYVNKMSDYCENCAYSVKEKTGDKACPLNYLYWNFIDEQRDTFLQNGRANFMVNTFDKKSNEEKLAIKESSETFLANLPRWSKKDWLEKEASPS
jgi:deoxyribodipyrimidine photolyase-related protein